MSLDEDETSAMLTGAKLQFWADHVPVPGGDDILISVYDATGEKGAAGNRLAGPSEAKAKRDLNNWREVDLSQLGILVEDDFYIDYLQAYCYPFVPRLLTYAFLLSIISILHTCKLMIITMFQDL